MIPSTHDNESRVFILKRPYLDMDTPSDPPYTPKQGQYLAFIHYYTKIHRRPPAEADMQRYFEVSPPAVHQMIVTLDEKGLIERKPGQPRTIRNVLSRENLPDLE